MIGSLNSAAPMRPTAVSGPQQQRLIQAPIRSTSPSASQALASQVNQLIFFSYEKKVRLF